MDIQTHLLSALKLAKQNEQLSRNVKLTNDIASILRNNYKSTAEMVREITTGRIFKKEGATPQQAGTSKWVDRSAAPEAKKNLSVARKKDESEDLVAEVDDENLLGFILKSSPQMILDKFRTVKAIKDFAKKVGMDTDQTLEDFEFISALKDEVTTAFEGTTTDEVVLEDLDFDENAVVDDGTEDATKVDPPAEVEVVKPPRGKKVN